jgi:hypothetical protein
MTEQRTTDGVQLRERIDRYLEESGLGGPNPRVVPLTGDASDRRYFRIIPSDGPSIVLALHAGPIEFASLPFARVGELFQMIPLPVPGVLGHSDELGIIALQDLGDVTLQAHLGASSPAEHAALYRQDVTLIEQLQRRGADLESDQYPPYRVAFDVEKLTWELEFFTKHFLGAYRGVTPGAAERAALTEEWAAIVEELASEPRVLCHRDYHSRNLMLRDDSLYIIDFQDARMGPDTYDLASLLRDSYVDLLDEEVDDLIDYFLKLKGAAGTGGDFRRRFDLMALQRNLKALGTFGYMATVRGNAVYLPYIPPTLAHVRRNLARHPELAGLRRALGRHIEELA